MSLNVTTYAQQPSDSKVVVQQPRCNADW